jgi:serine protease AprX
MKHLLLALAGVTMTLQLQAKELKLKNAPVDLKTHSASSLMKLDGSDASLASKYFVIQFENAITDQDRKDLETNGFEILQYLPDDAYIVSGQFSKAVQLKNRNSKVYEVAPYMSEWKLSSELQSMSIFDNENKVILNVRLLPKANLSEVLAQVAKISDVKVLASSARFLALDATKLKALEISNIEGVEYLQVQPEIKTFDMDVNDEGRDDPPPNLGESKTGFESGTKVMNLDKAWERGYTGQGQTVSMADTGLDMGTTSNLHPDLQTVIGGESVAMFGGTTWEDPQGHGTHVTGSVISRGILSAGLIKGGAFNANYFAQGMWSSMFNNIMVPQDLGTMFLSAYNHGARIHTNSWGATQNFGTYDNMSAAVDQLMWDHPDMLILFAAGNNGQDINADGIIDLNSISSPGTAKNALTVGASENYIPDGGRKKTCGEMNNGATKWPVEPLKSDRLSNNIDGIACFSSRGPTADQRTKPDIVAPGTNIVSLQSRHPSATKLWGIYNENYSWAGGTSMATPLTAGAAAVAREYLQKNGRANPSAALVKATLMHTAFDIFPGQFGKGTGQEISQKGPNNQQGFGRVDMDSATKLNQSKVIDNQVGVGAGETTSVNFNITETRIKAGGSLKATLVYTDAPAAASAGKTLVNDLDLKITAPDGKIYSNDDHTNNAEGIEITDLTPGAYQVSVIGSNVPQGKNGKQPYALLVSFVKNQNIK